MSDALFAGVITSVEEDMVLLATGIANAAEGLLEAVADPDFARYPFVFFDELRAWLLDLDSFAGTLRDDMAYMERACAAEISARIRYEYRGPRALLSA